MHQRDEDTTTMMEMIMRKRNESIAESETFREEINASNAQPNDQEEILEIAEAIRELAAKLQLRRERCNTMESSPQLNSSLNRSLELIKGSIVSKPVSPQTKSKASDKHHSLDAYSRLKFSDDDKWRSDVATPKAGNLSMLEEKTPLHSNVSQSNLNRDRLVPYKGMCSKPYPLTSNKPIRKVEATQPVCSIDDSLAILRNELTKSKVMEYHNDNHSVIKKKHPFSTKSQRSSSRSKTDTNHDFGKSAPKLNSTNLNFDTTVKTFGKFRSLSAGRATQQGKQMINRILGRETQEDDADDKTLTATSSDSTHEPLPTTRRGKYTTLPDDAKLDIIVNHHYNSLRKATNSDRAKDHRQGGTDHHLQRSSSPNRTTKQNSKNKEQIRPITPFRSGQTSRARQSMTIDASISNASTTSGYLAHRPPMNSSSEKGFEIVVLDGVKPKMKSSSNDNDSRAGSNIDRAAISQRLQHHQKSIMDKLRKDLSVTTDLRDDYDSVSDQMSTTATAAKYTKTNTDSTRATIMSDDKRMNDISSKSISSSHSSSSPGNTNTAVVTKKRVMATKQRRSIIRE